MILVCIFVGVPSGIEISTWQWGKGHNNCTCLIVLNTSESQAEEWVSVGEWTNWQLCAQDRMDALHSDAAVPNAGSRAHMQAASHASSEPGHAAGRRQGTGQDKPRL